MLYLGYVGFSVPFAFALGALMMRYPGEKWIRITRVWTMVTWLFLTCGIFLGMHWAYAVLGWGGYWGWDPVENASFMPWLTGTAFLHSVMMQERKGMMKSWNVWLIFSTFLLTMLGTLLTRAGLVSSVHAFAQSSIGTWFVVFMGIVLAVCIFTYILQRGHLQTEHHLESLVSRESSFLFNNLVLLTACFVILWGTLFPILSEYVVGQQSHGGRAVLQPRGCAHRAVSRVPYRRRSAAAVALHIVQGHQAQFCAAGHRAVGHGDCLPGRRRAAVEGRFSRLRQLLCARWLLPSAAAVLTAIAASFFAAPASSLGRPAAICFAATWLLTRRNTRRYGGYIVHIGVVVVVHRAGRLGLQSQHRKAKWACTAR